MYLIHKVIVITCLRDPKSLLEFKIKFQIQSFQVLYSVDWLSQSAIVENLIESN
jgi:hypothetical protein